MSTPDTDRSQETVTAALVVIGEEILSGRTRDENIAYIAAYLTRIGISLREVRIVADLEAAIGEAVNELRPRFAYIFATGGIGPTHDDVTTDAIAKAFGVGERRRRRPEFRQRVGRAAQDRGALHEIQNAKARREARGTFGRQHMVGAADIVADGLRRIGAEEDCAGVLDAAGQGLRIARCDLNMFGCEAIGECDGIEKIADDDDGAMLLPTGAGDFFARQRA